MHVLLVGTTGQLADYSTQDTTHSPEYYNPEYDILTDHGTVCPNPSPFLVLFMTCIPESHLSC